MKIWKWTIVRTEFAEEHAMRIENRMRLLEGHVQNADNRAMAVAMSRLHEVLYDAAIDAGVVNSLSGGTPKPPREN